MPIIEQSSYIPPKLFTNGHVQTLYPYFFRKVSNLSYKRIRMNTRDGDFLDLDLSSVGSNKLVILSHGLEGSSESPYIKGMAKHFNDKGVDALAWNMRSCSGEVNLLERFYHGGDVEELDEVIKYSKNLNSYEEVYLIGFSLGANLTAKYLGEMGDLCPKYIKKVVMISNPCDLESSIEALSRPSQKIFLNDFLTTMKKKVIEKDQLYGMKSVDITGLKKIKTFHDFDDRFTAPLSGFKNAIDYYRKVSCKNVIPNIKVPTLIINAKNDPFLGKGSFPIRECYKNPFVFLELPPSGGHVGFPSFTKCKTYWTERRAEEFILRNKVISDIVMLDGFSNEKSL